MTNKQIADAIGMCRQTVGKKMKELKAYGYVIEDGQYFKLPKRDYYALIPQEILKFLSFYVVDGDDTIKLFIILWNYYLCNKTFSMIDLHKRLGYSMSPTI